MKHAARTAGALAALLAACALGGCGRDPAGGPGPTAATAASGPAPGLGGSASPDAAAAPGTASEDARTALEQLAQVADLEEPTPNRPAPPHPIAGLRGLRTRGEVRFASDPDDVHELDTLFVFPDRARAHMFAKARPTLSSWTEMRRGDELHKRDAVGSPARVLEGEEALGLLLRLERRRALSLYPDGFDWQDGPLLGSGERHVRVEGPAGLLQGGLWARLDASGRAVEIGSRTENSDGGSLLVTAWHALGDRQVPAELEFRWVDENDTVHTIWNETVVSFEADVRYRDEGIFVPGTPGGFRQSVRTDLQVELPADARSVESLAGSSPAAWRVQLAATVARTEAGGAHDLDPTLRVQLDAEGRPAGLLVLSIGAGPAPEGFEPASSRRALQRLLPDRPDNGWERLDEGALGALAEALEGLRAAASEARAGTPGTAYLRLPTPGSGGSAQLVLPLGP